MQNLCQEKLNDNKPIFSSKNPEYDLVREAIERTNTFSLLVSGESMHPLFLPGDELKVESTSLNKMQPGDIVVYEINSRVYSHRLMRRTTVNDQECLLTKGDANLFWDIPLTKLVKKSVLGKVTVVYRNGQLIYLNNKPWLIAGNLVTCLSHLTGFVHNRANEQEPSIIPWHKLALFVSKILRRLTILVEHLSVFALVRCNLGRHNSRNVIRTYGPK